VKKSYATKQEFTVKGLVKSRFYARGERVKKKLRDATRVYSKRISKKVDFTPGVTE